MRNTIEYYDQNAESFINETIAVDFTQIQNMFLEMLPKNGNILDLGCGSGRDTKYFLDHGYRVTAVDGSSELCKSASEYTGINVRHMLFHELKEVETYDGVWACASVLHARRAEIADIFSKMCTAAKINGIIYASFKYGEFEGERNGRYFTDMTEETMLEILKDVPELKVEKQWITGDVRTGRGDERWLNIILRK